MVRLSFITIRAAFATLLARSQLWNAALTRSSTLSAISGRGRRSVSAKRSLCCAKAATGSATATAATTLVARRNIENTSFMRKSQTDGYSLRTQAYCRQPYGRPGPTTVHLPCSIHTATRRAPHFGVAAQSGDRAGTHPPGHSSAPPPQLVPGGVLRGGGEVSPEVRGGRCCSQPYCRQPCTGRPPRSRHRPGAVQATIELAGQLGRECAHCWSGGAGCVCAVDTVIAMVAGRAQTTNALLMAARTSEERSTGASDSQKSAVAFSVEPYWWTA